MTGNASSSRAPTTHPVVAVIPVDVVDRGGMGRRINVRVEGAAPVVEAAAPIVARIRHAGALTTRAWPWRREDAERTVDYRGFQGRTYETCQLPFVVRPGMLRPDEPLQLIGGERDMLRLRGVSRYSHAATGRIVLGPPPGSVPEVWNDALADRYDLTWAGPVVSEFRTAVGNTLLVAGGVLLKAVPLPRWWANVHGNEIALEPRLWETNHLRNADVFGPGRLDSARRYIAAKGGGEGDPAVRGGVEFLDPAYVEADDLPALCRVLAPWVANRWARHLADLPADLVRRCHDAANYSGEAFGLHEDRVQLLSALAEMMALSAPLPEVRRGEWPAQAIDAHLVRLHAVEGIPRYGAEERPPAPAWTGGG